MKQNFKPNAVRRTLLAIAMASGLCALPVQAAKPVTLLVPYPAGGTSDAIARMLQPRMANELGQTVIVENLGGAGGGIAAQKLLRAPSDGENVFVGSPNELILAPLSTASLKYKSEEFRMVQKIGEMTLVIMTRPDLPVSNADELATYAIKSAKEGKPLTYGSVGNGSFYHLLGEKMSAVIGAPMTHVPYKGGAPLMQDLIGSRIDIFIGVSAASTVALDSQGKLKVISTLMPERVPAFKSAASVRESKALKEFVYSFWLGLFVKKDTPEAIVQSLHKAASAVVVDPSLAPLFEAQTVVPSRPLSLTEAEQLYRTSTEQFRAIAKSINLQPE